ncbi:hypothetical protein, partial [Enterovirga sp.]|uniref:hypothetical protein n=1 Tax=Enterovirga sp. TaxID=2026350 RepID=UPI002C4465E6
MSRWDKPAGRIVPARMAAPLKVGGAVLGQMEKPEDNGPRPRFRNHQRLSEIERLIEYRCGIDYNAPGTIWTSDETYLRAALPTLLFTMREPGCPAHRSSLGAWIDAHLPCLSDRPQWWLDELLAEFTTYPRRKPRRADGIARDLNVTWEEHETLDLHSISFVGGTPEVKAEIRRIKDRARKLQARREKGAVSRSEYEGASATAVEPWIAAGVSRATYYRRQKSVRETSPSANELVETGLSANARETSASAVSPVGTGRAGRTCLIRGIPRIADRKGGDRPLSSETESEEREKSLDASADRPRARPARASHSTPPPALEDRGQLRIPVRAALPSQPADAVQLSILPEPQADGELRTACEQWGQGPMPETIRIAYVAAKRRRAVRQEDVATAIGISRPQLANALHRTFNLSPGAAERLKCWLLAPDSALPPAAEMG